MSNSEVITYKVFKKQEAQEFLNKHRSLHYNPIVDLFQEHKTQEPRIKDLHERLRYVDRTELWNTHFATQDPMTYHVAIQGKLIVGWASLRESPYQKDTLWLQGLSVDPEYRNKGIAKQLVTTIAKQAVTEKQTIEVSGYTYMGNKFLKPVIDSIFKRVPSLKYTESTNSPKDVCENDVIEADIMGYTDPEIESYRNRYLTKSPVELYR
jgi:GNAT superfamily N-acetyltransferase